MSVEVIIQNKARSKNVPTQKQFKNWAEETLKKIPKFSKLSSAELVIRLISKNESAQLNQSFRGKQGPTNILSFSYESTTMPKKTDTPILLGDLAICSALVAEEAKNQQKKIITHWAHLTIHGTLHLLGYDHETLPEAKVMEKLEKKVMSHLGYPNPYEESK